MKLWLIDHTDGNGESQQLFVRALDRAHAVAYWWEYYQRGGYDEEPDYVWEVPDREGPEGAVNWDQIIEAKEQANASDHTGTVQP